MMSLSTATEYARGMLDDGKLPNVAAANVQIVRMMGVRIIDCPMPQAVRVALRAGVKAGELGHLPKKGLLPEAFFHPNGKANAMEERERIARKAIEALGGRAALRGSGDAERVITASTGGALKMPRDA